MTPHIAFFNNKGGVGKTSLVYHCAYLFAEQGLRVLVADLDPQSNLSIMALDEARLLALDAQVDLELVYRHLGSIVAICAGLPEGGPIAQLPLRARFHWLTAKRSSIIQTSPSHMGVCTQPGEALQRILQRMVLPLQTEK